MKKSYQIILFSALVLSLSSCSSIFQRIYGMKSVKPVDEKMVLKHCKKFNIPEEKCFILDNAYFSYLFSMDTVKFKTQVKNHYQPLQALYYDRDGMLQSFQVNCYTGGFPNLDWEKEGTFSTFPPKLQAPTDEILPLDKHLEFLNPINENQQAEYRDTDYIILVHWNRFMGRQSKRLIQLVQENAQLAQDKKILIIYANNDNLYLEEEDK